MNKVLTKQIGDISKEEAIINLLKKGIWLYFFLLIFEGALRKWFLPFLATPLLIVRDPVALWLIYICWKHNIIKVNLYVIIMTFLTIISVSTALVLGHGNLMVAIFGARILIIHFPVMFIIGKVFSLEDVIKIGKVLLIIAIPMAILIALQFYSPQSAWVNRGVGGDMEGAGFSGALGYFRPPGTFSFITGSVMFFCLVGSFVFYFWLSKVKINRLLLIVATFSLFASVPLSISRTLLFTVGLIFIFALLSVAGKPKFFMRLVLFLVLGIMVLTLLSKASFFQTATEAFTHRFDSASNAEGGVSTSLIHRTFGGMISAITESSEDLPFFGYGLGIGTNAGAALLTGERKFLIAEGEWLRMVGEMGFVIGVLVVLLRVLFCADITMKSYIGMKSGNLLPWLLLSAGFLIILKGQWAQPTVLGFSTLTGGLILAALNDNRIDVKNNNADS
ncbi:hypothetical protein SAMN05428642_103524 [Flaviramulus basaltis]|uniref:O-Antigen ligase n=1 Tax=Flaviramulus basaltis TaxID=369401 RepID=A0A1K2INK5_9FLAO|nr:hypothetical protein [Flaviramulus basaltis]SFZ94029.1 hypothetical protein SAMN05428642_103524 [Flaviramulus basaltis]